LGRYQVSVLPSPTRAVFAGGTNHPNSPTIVNTIDYVEIMTMGNAVDFGDVTYLTSAPGGHAKGNSNGHGGL
jgi:hypothetical protein